MKKLYLLTLALSCLAGLVSATSSYITPPSSKTITSATQAIMVTGLTAATSSYTFSFAPASGAVSTSIVLTASASTTAIHVRFIQTPSETKVYIEENSAGTAPQSVILPASLSITPSANLTVTISPPVSLTAAWKGFTYDDAVQLNTLLNAGSFTDSISRKIVELFAFYYKEETLTTAQLVARIDSNTYLNTLKQKLRALPSASQSNTVSSSACRIFSL